MLVTSATKVLFPGFADVISPRLHYGLRQAQLSLVEAMIVRQLDSRLKPVLGLAIGALHVNVHTHFFTREEVESKTILPKNSGAHRYIAIRHFA